VPVAGLICGVDALPPAPAPPHAARPAVITSKHASANCGTRLRVRLNQAPDAVPSPASRSNQTTATGRPGVRPPGIVGGDTAECGVVEMDRVTVIGALPGVTVAEGEKLAVDIGGKFAAANVTELLKAPFEGATVKLKLAGWPADTEEDAKPGVTV
jgi:hypothetical protein